MFVKGSVFTPFPNEETDQPYQDDQRDHPDPAEQKQWPQPDGSFVLRRIGRWVGRQGD